ncbi:Curli production assembly/transport component CsgG [Gelidibacter maritimus]|uniref:Curli production assembly/transport component CsgG n=1 Tax=Gelidibacter maritimus TaxID=2761487 RepID=A0A7W2M5A7_9FLAO|nr:Curli production assembly/transport component CsgG [Gelidibacter maritimus]MBA6152971.1 Curli production assembly/transport component CsgG [Gelidibacter maritimus]
MKIYPFFIKNISLVFLTLFSFKTLAQNETLTVEENFNKKAFFTDFRGMNAAEAAIGTSNVNGDLPNPIFEIAFRVGYKRSLSPHLNLGFTYNKFNLAFEDIYNEGFMSFDLNLEYLMAPYHRFSPFLFAGGGLNAANYFTQSAAKFQGGAGIEVIAAKRLGLRLMADYNYVFSDTLDGVIAGGSDDAYWRILFGTTIYFGDGNKKGRLLKDTPSIMNSNPILEEN